MLHLLLPLCGARAAISQWQLDVFVHRQVADQVERLENKSNLAVADPRALANREIRHRRSVHRIIAARLGIEQPEMRAHSRLTTTHGPRVTDHFTLLHY